MKGLPGCGTKVPKRFQRGLADRANTRAFLGPGESKAMLSRVDFAPFEIDDLADAATGQRQQFDAYDGLPDFAFLAKSAAKRAVFVRRKPAIASAIWLPRHVMRGIVFDDVFVNRERQNS